MLICSIIALFFFLEILIVAYSLPFIHSLDQISYHQFTLIFGAGVDKSGVPSDILLDRVKTGIKLIQKEKTEFLIMSGGPEETKSMVENAKISGVAKLNILVDSGGFSTLDSLKNNRKNYGDGEIILVSQFFHVPRALFLAGILGIKAKAVIAKGYSFSMPKTAYWCLRELFAIPYNLFKVALSLKDTSKEKDYL